MKIAVIGAGAIGGLVGASLKLQNEDVILVARPEAVEKIQAQGVRIYGVRGNFTVKIPACEKLSFDPDLVIFATKTQDLKAAIEENLPFIKDATIVTTQNGVRSEEIIAGYVPETNIISSIVMFGSTSLEYGRVIHNFDGPWIIGRINGVNDAEVKRISYPLNKAFSVIITENIRGMKYLKLFVNANNCLPALLGKSMQEAFADSAISQIAIAIWKEGLGIIEKAKIELMSLPDFPLERLTKLTSLPLVEAGRIYTGIMSGLSKEPLYGSILQSIKRGRESEIDYINGEFVHLARQHSLSAPLNDSLVEMVHRVEQTKTFYTKEEVITRLKQCFVLPV